MCLPKCCSLEKSNKTEEMIKKKKKKKPTGKNVNNFFLKNNDSPLPRRNDHNFWNLIFSSTLLSKHNEQSSIDCRFEGEIYVSMFGRGTVVTIKSGRSFKESLTQGPEFKPRIRVYLSRELGKTRGPCPPPSSEHSNLCGDRVWSTLCSALPPAAVTASLV